MGLLMPVLSIAQFALGAVTAFAQMSAADAQYEAEVDAQNRQIKAQYAEVSRQQEEVIRIAQEQASDRIRLANQELGSVRVTALERGVSGSTMLNFARSIAYLEGVDISRINKERDANIAAGEAARRSARNGYITSVTIADNQRKVAKTDAMLGLVGSGLSILGGFAKNSATLSSYQNINLAA